MFKIIKKPQKKSQQISQKMSLKLFFLLFSLYFPVILSHDHPIMGILTLPSTASPAYPSTEFSYFGAGYVKFLESAGIRVIPIPYDTPEGELEQIFSKINGILLPGGGSSLYVDEAQMLGFSNLTLTSHFLLELAIKANLQGDYFPVWGTCLGLEMLFLDVTSDSKALDVFNSTNHHGNLLFLNKKSRVFHGIDENLKLYAETEAPAYFYHTYGKNYEKFMKNQLLRDFFEVNTVSQDLDGVWFVSSAEAKHFPIYVSQFHPEMNIFEWKSEDHVNHSPESIRFSQFLANFIGKEARKNRHRFENREEEEKFLIYNYNPVQVEEFYEQVYFFRNRQ